MRTILTLVVASLVALASYCNTEVINPTDTTTWRFVGLETFWFFFHWHRHQFACSVVNAYLSVIEKCWTNSLNLCFQITVYALLWNLPQQFDQSSILNMQLITYLRAVKKHVFRLSQQLEGHTRRRPLPRPGKYTDLVGTIIYYFTHESEPFQCLMATFSAHVHFH